MVVVDLRKFDTVEKFHDYISKTLGFARYYGANLDALNDEISSIGGIEFEVIKGGRIDPEVQDAIEKILLRK